MRKLPALGALRAFEAAARRLSFKAAAEELHVTPTAISHQVRHLEDATGVKLFERSVRKVTLTAAGQQLFPVLRDGFDSFESALNALRRSPPQKVATLSSTFAFMARQLAPRAGTFAGAFPGWSLRLDSSDRPVDLDSVADAAIRYGTGHYPGLVTATLFQDRFAPVCSPALAIRTLPDLKKSTLIHFEWGPLRGDERALVWRQWLAAAKAKGVDAEAGLRFTEELPAVQATIAGQGVGLLSLTLVQQELASGVLVQPFELELGSFSYDFVYSPRAAKRPSTQVLREWVTAQFCPAGA